MKLLIKTIEDDISDIILTEMITYFHGVLVMYWLSS